MAKDESAKFAGFWQKVEEATKDDLTKQQQELLLACLWLAWVSTAQEDDLLNGFQGSFTPDQAAALVKYHAGSGTVSLLPRIVDHSIQTVTKSIRT